MPARRDTDRATTAKWWTSSRARRLRCACAKTRPRIPLEFDGLDRRTSTSRRASTRPGDAFGTGGDAVEPRAQEARTVEVRLKRWRKWEGEESVRERFAVTLKIR